MPTHHGVMVHTPEHIKRYRFLSATTPQRPSISLVGCRRNFYLIKGLIVHRETGQLIITILNPGKDYFVGGGDTSLKMKVLNYSVGKSSAIFETVFEIACRDKRV